MFPFCTRIMIQHLLLMLLLSLFAGCHQGQSGKSSTEESDAIKGLPTVVASLSPHVWLATEIGGDQVEVVPLMPAGENPENWAPAEEALFLLGNADLIIINGSMLEKWVQRVSLPFSILDLSRSVKDHWQEYPGVITHSHGPEGERSWEGTDGHFWIDPALLKLQGEEILQRLIRLVPSAEKLMRARWKNLSEKISTWESRLAAVRISQEDTLVATEPAWGYLAHRLGISLRTISPATNPRNASGLSDRKKKIQVTSGLPDQLLNK